MPRRPSSRTRRLVAAVVLGVLVGVAAGSATAVLADPGYRSSAVLLIRPSGTSPLPTSEVQYAQAVSQIVTDPSVLSSAGVDPDRVDASASPNAPLIEVAVTATTADVARRDARAAAEAVVGYIADRVGVLGFRALVFTPATVGEPAGLPPAAAAAAGAAAFAFLFGLAALMVGDRRHDADAAVARPHAPSDDGRATSDTLSAAGRP